MNCSWLKDHTIEPGVQCSKPILHAPFCIVHDGKLLAVASDGRHMVGVRLGDSTAWAKKAPPFPIKVQEGVTDQIGDWMSGKNVGPSVPIKRLRAWCPKKERDRHEQHYGKPSFGTLPSVQATCRECQGSLKRRCRCKTCGKTHVAACAECDKGLVYTKPCVVDRFLLKWALRNVEANEVVISTGRSNHDQVRIDGTYWRVILMPVNASDETIASAPAFKFPKQTKVSAVKEAASNRP